MVTTVVVEHHDNI